MNKQEFIIAQLKPYFLDPSTCGIGKEGCMYLTHDGKMCVLGKNLTPEALEKFHNSVEKASKLLITHGETILKEESRGILSSEEWQAMQYIHDKINRDIHDKINRENPTYNYEAMMRSLDNLSSNTCDLTELKDLARFHFNV
jgi:hypothetical protein